MANSKQLLLLTEFQKFITASSTGRRLMPSGKKIRKGTLVQYHCVYKLLEEYEATLDAPLRIQLLNRSTLRLLQKEKTTGQVLQKFAAFLYQKKKYFDQYTSGVFKVVKPFSLPQCGKSTSGWRVS
ncbi:MAG: hypothetical protein IPH18_00060 [Chitinophagaceae bacterium]|nr:hypothetical protein [Chitinophagaceae bacterium]